MQVAKVINTTALATTIATDGDVMHAFPVQNNLIVRAQIEHLQLDRRLELSIQVTIQQPIIKNGRPCHKS